MMNKEIFADLEIILSKLPLRLQEIYRTDYLPKISIIKKFTYPYSHICLVEVDQDNNSIPRLFIKQIIPNNKSKASIQQTIESEVELLNQLELAMSSSIVRLVDVFPKQLSLVTEECQGKKMDLITSSIGFWWWQEELQCKIAGFCGHWLKQLHQTTTSSSRSSLQPWYDYLSGEMIWRLRLLSERLPEYRILFQLCQKRFIDDLQKLNKQGVLHDYHGDFAAHNIFVQEEKIQVIDFYAARKGHGSMDVINFISSFATHAESGLYPKQSIRKFCYNFINAYGSINCTDPRLPVLILVLQAIKRLTVLATTNNSKIPLIHAFNKKKWYLDYIYLYLDDRSVDKSISGPWPFTDLSELF